MFSLHAASYQRLEDFENSCAAYEKALELSDDYLTYLNYAITLYTNDEPVRLLTIRIVCYEGWLLHRVRQPLQRRFGLENCWYCTGIHASAGVLTGKGSQAVREVRGGLQKAARGGQRRGPGGAAAGGARARRAEGKVVGLLRTCRC
jgi:hypothetical protein